MIKKLILTAFILNLNLFNVAIAQHTPEDIKELASRTSLTDVILKGKRLFQDMDPQGASDLHQALKRRYRPDNIHEVKDFSLDTFLLVSRHMINQAYSEYKSSTNKLKIRIEFTVYEYPIQVQEHTPRRVLYNIFNRWHFKQIGFLQKEKTIATYIEIDATQFLEELKYVLLFSLSSKENTWDYSANTPDAIITQIKKQVHAGNQKITISIVLGKHKSIIKVRPGHVSFYETNRDQIISELRSEPTNPPPHQHPPSPQHP